MFVGRERVDSIAPSGERVIIAIDEYPYLAASYPAISSLLQSHIDSCWKDSRIFFDFMWFLYELYGGAGIGL